jgi:RNA polymerase sigma-70 factor (ECF subfamily)
MTAAARDRVEAEVRAALTARDQRDATERALRGFGPEILGWLHSTLAGDTEAGDAFALFAEELWRSLDRFDGRCSIRTWCYTLARHAAYRVREARAARRDVPLSSAPISAVAAEVRATTLAHLRTDVKDRVRALRAQLDPDDQTLLVLRVDRDLGWREIAQVLLGPDADTAAIERQAATLRKRFERVKQRLRELAAG